MRKLTPLPLALSFAFACASPSASEPDAAPPASPDAAAHPTAKSMSAGHHGGGHHAANELGYRGHRFEDPAEWAPRFDAPERDAWQKPDALVASFGLESDSRVADLGAGTGYFAVRFAAALPQGRVVAVDIEPRLVEYINERAQREGLTNLEARPGHADRIGLSEPMDLLFMCDVFHHLLEPSTYFESAAEALAPGGRIVIVDFRADNPDDAPGPPKAMRLPSSKVVELMADAGYVLVDEDRELLPFQYVLSFRLTDAA